jgi:hypothetical protein
MKFGNIELKRSDVKSASELYRGFSKTRVFRGSHNLRDIITAGDLLKSNMCALASAYESIKNKPNILVFHDENVVVIKELGRLAESHPDFHLSGEITETFYDDIDDAREQNTLAVVVKDGTVVVTIL